MAKVAKKKKAAKAAVPEYEPRSAAARRRLEGEERDYTLYLDKAPTDLQDRLADWLIDKVGVEFDDDAEEQAFREGVRLCGALRMDFQASPENQTVLAERRAAKAAGDDEEDEAPAKPKKSTGKKAKPKKVVDDEPDDEEDEEDEQAPAPKPKARRATKAKAAADSKPKARRTAKTRKAAADDSEDAAPY